MEDKNLQYSIKPKFNIIYEILMPTGRKLRNSIFLILIMIIGYIILGNNLNVFSETNKKIVESTDVNMVDIFSKVFFVILIAIIIKFLINLIAQIMQYRSMSYNFYTEHLEYEDTFLNQHKKTLRYENVREIEIRRTVWDRLNGYGIIVLYSNAEKTGNNGIIVYSIKQPQKVYEIIDEIIHRKSNEKNMKSSNIEQNENNLINSEEEF